MSEPEVIPIHSPRGGHRLATGQHVLVLNQDWAPMATARVRRALVLLDKGKAELLERGVAPIITPSCTLDRPSVIRLLSFVRRPRPRLRLTRHNVFTRDGYQCVYCGVRPRHLTIDHVLPLSRGGDDRWDNVVTSCQRCNYKKGARTPPEARMALRHTPTEPRVASVLHLLGVIDAQPEWLPYLPAT